MMFEARRKEGLYLLSLGGRRPVLAQGFYSLDHNGLFGFGLNNFDGGEFIAEMDLPEESYAVLILEIDQRMDIDFESHDVRAAMDEAAKFIFRRLVENECSRLSGHGVEVDLEKQITDDAEKQEYFPNDEQLLYKPEEASAI